METEKTLTVKTGSKRHPIEMNVWLNGVLPGEKLTPKMARRAARVALGREYAVVVWDKDHNYGYRLYKNSARKIQGK